MTCEEIMCDANVLYRAYLASVKNSKWKSSSQQFSLNYLRRIFSIIDDCKDRTLQNGKVNEFILHERGKIRPISSVCTRDRVIRHALCDDILLPAVRKMIIYDNGASLKGRGISFSRKRFEVHLRKYYAQHKTDGFVLFGDFSKFYDNILHNQAKQMLLDLYDDDEFLDWLLTIIFKSFEVDVSYMSDEDYLNCENDLFDKLKYREISEDLLTGDKFMQKSVNIGDQLSQVLGVYYPHRIDSYIKYVRSQKYYGRYMDDWYVISHSKEELKDILENVKVIASDLGIHINDKKTKIVRLDKPLKYLQIVYSFSPDGKIIKRLNTDRITAMRRKLKKLAVKVSEGSVPYFNVENTFKSWMGAHYKLMTRDQLNAMIRLFEQLFGKHITIKDKQMLINDSF